MIHAPPHLRILRFHPVNRTIYAWNQASVLRKWIYASIWMWLIRIAFLSEVLQGWQLSTDGWDYSWINAFHSSINSAITKEWALPWMSLAFIDRVRPHHSSPEFLTLYDTVATRKARWLFRFFLIPCTYIRVQVLTNKTPLCRPDVRKPTCHQVVRGNVLQGQSF